MCSLAHDNKIADVNQPSRVEAVSYMIVKVLLACALCHTCFLTSITSNTRLQRRARIGRTIVLGIGNHCSIAFGLQAIRTPLFCTCSQHRFPPYHLHSSRYFVQSATGSMLISEMETAFAHSDLIYHSPARLCTVWVL
jgi:hypothetical protein